MCLGIPMRIKKIEKTSALAETDGLERAVDIRFLKKPRLGDYVIVHAGFAIEKVNRKKARETLKLYREIQP